MKTQQRGSGWSIALVFNLYRVFGYRFIYILMYPVTFFYFIFATNVRSSLEDYYKNIQKPFNNLIYFEHLRIFANCMVDRFISKLTDEPYEVEFQHTNPKDTLEQGCIVLTSHFGGWALSANEGSKRVKNKINVVMQEAMLDTIKNIENQKEYKDNIHIIDLNRGGIAVSIEVANALSNNEIVAIMGDRAASEKGEIALDFFGKQAKFNKNPFQIAYKTNKPVLAYFIIFLGMKRYLVEYIHITLDSSIDEKEAVEVAMKQYIKKYEQIINLYPNQWFNFYEFWEERGVDEFTYR